MADVPTVVNQSEGVEATQETPPVKVRSRFKCQRVFGPRDLRIACTIFVIVSFIILIIAITTNNWMGDGQMSVGLWYTCLRPLCARTPDYIHPGAAALKVVHTMLFVAVFFAFGSIIILGASFFRPRIRSTSLALLSGIASIIAAIFILIGMSVYLHGSQKEKAAVHSEWSFYAGWISCSLFLLTVDMNIVRGFMASALATCFLALIWSVEWDHIIHCDFVFIPKALATAVFNFISGICVFVALLVFFFSVILEMDEVPHIKKWAFYLSIAICILNFLTGTLDLFSYKNMLWGMGKSSTHVAPEVETAEQIEKQNAQIPRLL